MSPNPCVSPSIYENMMVAGDFGNGPFYVIIKITSEQYVVHNNLFTMIWQRLYIHVQYMYMYVQVL